MTPNSIRTLYIAFALLLFSCGAGQRDEAAVVGEAPTNLTQSKKRFLNPLLTVRAWPFDDGKTQYRLSWDGADSKLPLFEEPDPNSELLGEVSYKQGQVIETSGDVVSVYQPAIFRTRKRLRLSGRVHNPGSGSHKQLFSKELKKGATIGVYLYAGRDECYVGVAGRVIVAPCPTPQDYIGTFEGPPAFAMQPLSKIWWVYITTPIGDGWLPLDDRVIADILPLNADPEKVIAKSETKPKPDPAEETPTDPNVEAREEAMFGEPGEEVATAETNREDAMFGSADPEASTESEEGGTGGGLGERLLSDEEIESRLDAKSDVVTVGAYSLLQLQYFILEEEDPENYRISAPALLDLYLDGRPNERVRLYARGRLTGDFAGGGEDLDVLGDEVENLSVDLDQLWMKFDIGRAVYATLGKQRIKWGTGRFWNPTDFLNTQARDPLGSNVLDTRLGVTMAKLHIPFEKLGWNAYAIATLEGAQTPLDVGVAARMEFLFQNTEFSLSGALREGEPTRVGADLSTGFWNIDLRLEGAALINDERSYYRGDIRIPSILPEEYSRADDIIPQLVAGFDWSVPYRRGDLLVFGGEFFYNDAGYEDPDLYPWILFNGRFEAFYAGRMYFAGFAGLYGPGSWDDTSIIATTIGNLSDNSYVSRLDISQTVFDYLRWFTFANVHYGDTGEFFYGLKLRPNIFSPDGVVLYRPLVDVGIGLELDL